MRNICKCNRCIWLISKKRFMAFLLFCHRTNIFLTEVIANTRRVRSLGGIFNNVTLPAHDYEPIPCAIFVTLYWLTSACRISDKSNVLHEYISNSLSNISLPSLNVMHCVRACVQIDGWKEYNTKIRLLCSLIFPCLTFYTSFELTRRLTW